MGLKSAALVTRIVANEVRAAVAVHGVGGTVVRCLRHAGDVWALRASQRKAESVPDAFDVSHGVRTRVTMDLQEMHDVKRRGGHHHEPSPPARFREILAQLDVRFEDHVFVDYGSGAGRAVLLAAEHPFKEIIGVELSPALHARAQANVQACRNPAQRCHAIRLVCTDATAFDLPAAPAVLYFYNPFGVGIMRGVLANIEASLARHPRPLLAVHMWSRREALKLFADSPRFAVAQASRDVMVYASRPTR